MKTIEITDIEKFKLEVAQLPEEYRDVLLTFSLEKLNQKETAAKLNLSKGVFRNRLTKGIYLWKKIASKY